MSASLVVAAALLMVATGLFAGSPRAARLRATPAGQRRSLTAQIVALVAVGVLAALLFGGVVAQWTAFIVAGAQLLATVGWLGVKGVAERKGLLNQRQVIKACSMMAGQLDAGEIPAQALVVTAAEVCLLGPAAGAVGIGGDVAAELSKLARLPGCAGLDWVSRAWRLCASTGMPLSPVMRQVADSLRAQGDVRDQRRAELASAKSTSRLLAGLPVVGIGMGFLVQADPLSFLMGSLAGHICLVGATTLMCAGLIWSDHLAKESP